MTKTSRQDRQEQLDGLRSMLAIAEKQLANATPRDVAGEPADRVRNGKQRKVDNLRAAVARVEAKARLEGLEV